MTSLRAWQAAALAVALLAVPRIAHAGGRAVIGGRIVVRDGTHELSAAEVERSRWGHLAVEMRHGWEVYSARPDASGVFTIEGPPGTYRLDYIRIGELAEFVAPHEVQARRGVVTCMGTLEIVVQDLVNDLGNNKGSELHVRQDCSSLDAELRQRAAGAEVIAVKPRAVPPPGRSRGIVETATGLRLGLGLSAPSDHVATLRGSFVLDLTEGDDWGHWIASATVTRLGAAFSGDRWPAPAPTTSDPPAQAGWAGDVGAGYYFFGFELQAFAGYLAHDGRGAHGPSGGVGLRFGHFLLGFYGRYDWYPATGDRVGTVGLEVSPIGLLGALL